MAKEPWACDLLFHFDIREEKKKSSLKKKQKKAVQQA